MQGISALEMLLRLSLAVLLGGFIGLERESHRRPAGFRTHILVCLGSALVMLISIYAFSGTNRDPSRLAAQVVSGIGFLGAGTIMREGTTIKGLTTAASLWVVSGIGLAVGSGFYLSAVAATALAVLTLMYLDSIEHKVLSKSFFQVRLRMVDKPGEFGKLGTLLGQLGVNISALAVEEGKDEEAIVVMQLHLPGGLDRFAVLDKIGQLEGITKIQVDD